MVEEIDLRHIPYMPLVIDRLRRSKAWLQCKRRPELAFHMMNLWMHSWHEVPAGSIEADDDVLADAAMCSPERWDEIKGAVLRGWEQGEDGRLYHHVVVELADEAVGKMRSSRARTKKAREALEAKRRSEQSNEGDDDRGGSVAVSVTDAVTEAVAGGEGKGREGKTSGMEEPNGSPIPGADAPSLLDGLGAGDIQRQPKGATSNPMPAASTSDTSEKRLFDRGKEVLGSSAGGMIAKLRKKLDHDDEHALRTINLAAEKQNPREWIGRLLAGDASAETDDYAAEVRRRNQEWGVL